jgi:biofilm PGA synthesis N-glycosyltransferase PgaC
VIAQCLDAVCRSKYRGLNEIIVIDDGSTDDTAEIVGAMASRDQRIRLIRQTNRGKPAALNRAVVEAQNEVVVTLDADTLFTPYTIERLVQRFARDPAERLGAVAGNVKVGNLGNAVTRWQALEYIMQIGVDRSAQDALRAIVVVPGACAAWRRTAVIEAGGFSSETLAEDCDLALQLQRLGYRVAQSVRAESFTEAPESFRQLSRQRFRWTFGNAQALWKHRSMILDPHHGWLGLFTLPLAALSILMPVVFLPFVYLMAVLTLSQQNGSLLLVYAAIFLSVQLLQAVAGVALTRERPVHLLMVPFYRLIAEPLRAYLLYKSALTVLRGTGLRWHKVTRNGNVVAQEPARVKVRL